MRFVGNYDKTCPCRKDCPRRTKGCHSTCEGYLQWKAEHDKKREAVAKQKRDEFHLYRNARNPYR